jgi:hypothetical protein
MSIHESNPGKQPLSLQDERLTRLVNQPSSFAERRTAASILQDYRAFPQPFLPLFELLLAFHEVASRAGYWQSTAPTTPTDTLDCLRACVDGFAC